MELKTSFTVILRARTAQSSNQYLNCDRAVGDPKFEYLLYRVEDRVATITLNRPEKLNALIDPVYAELFEAFDRVDSDDEVRAVIVTGAGRGYCAGRDLSGGGETFNYEDSSETHRDIGGRLTLRIFQLLKPIIAAVNGPAVGIGSTMLLPMDVRLASTKARFGFVFARRGIVSEAASSYFLPRVVGISRAVEWATTGRVFDAEEALAGGLVRSLHEPDDLLPAARSLALEIAESAPVRWR
jgi:enoyl-CoA hydratase/carnithine racemase